MKNVRMERECIEASVVKLEDALKLANSHLLAAYKRNAEANKELREAKKMTHDTSGMRFSAVRRKTAKRKTKMPLYFKTTRDRSATHY